MRCSNEVVSHIRDASRCLVRELGFLSPNLAGKELPVSAVQALIEIRDSTSTTASSLTKTLNLDRSNIGRILAKLLMAGAVIETTNDADARQKTLSITDKGMEIMDIVDKYTDEQVAKALKKLPAGTSQEQVLDGVRSYVAALREQRLEEEVTLAEPLIISSGYRPGLLGRCLEMHMQYYSLEVGFGASFESQLATGLGELLNRLDSPKNGTWAVTDGTNIYGTIFIDGGGGQGLGRKLIEQAMAFVDDHQFVETHLYTFNGLDAARRLYESCGFVLVEEAIMNKWGKEMKIQSFVRRLGGVAKVDPYEG
ncbi:MarR family transcriptional regulator [Stipitochalara longipes BDJ]|nr:MarR family transcriptional regulator [Stipitochalara longipes BDJ]